MAEINSSARLPILQLNWLSTSRAPDSTSSVADSVATQGCCSVAPRTPRGRKSFFCFGTKTANRAQEGSQSCDQKASLEPGEGLFLSTSSVLAAGRWFQGVAVSAARACRLVRKRALFGHSVPLLHQNQHVRPPKVSCYSARKRRCSTYFL